VFTVRNVVPALHWGEGSKGGTAGIIRSRKSRIPLWFKLGYQKENRGDKDREEKGFSPKRGKKETTGCFKKGIREKQKNKEG